MKTEFNEGQYGISICLYPETTEETAALLRYTRNANSEKASVHLSFHNKIYCNISLDKRKLSVQNNYITPNMK